MKKILSIIFCAGLMLSLYSQEVSTQAEEQSTNLISKKGISILPEKGEYSIGIDATPFLNYLGSIMNWGAGTAPSFSTPNDIYGIGISGKYMKTNNTAYRINLYTEATTYKNYYSVRKSELTPDVLAPQYAEDVSISNYENFTLTFGIEKRRGKSRVQGIYGIDAIIGVDASQLNYEYGNPITVDFNTPEIYLNSYGVNGERLIESSTENNYIFGARGFVGVEFFFGPKISLGGELSYALRYRTQGNTQNTYEYWSTTDLRVNEITRNVDYKGYMSLGLLTNTAGSINLNFYF